MLPFHRFAIAAMCLVGMTAAKARAQTGAPDILLLMPDQMRGDCLSALGHPVTKTPNLDALAEQGVLFRRGYSTVPSCTPARHALLTGQYPQTSGVVGFAGRPIRVPTLPQQLLDAGYATALVGRNMHQVPARDPYGFERVILGSTYVDDDEYDRWLRLRAPECGGIRAVVERAGLSFNGWQAGPWPLARDLHPTEWVVQRAIDVVAASGPEKPLFLTASFYAPHPPLMPPREFYDAAFAATPPAPAHGEWVHWTALSPEGDAQGHRVRLEGDALRRAQAGYFGAIAHLDAAVAPLLRAFRARAEQAERPWLVILVSDHGEMLGDHGYFRKCQPYEGSANIPFVVAGSKELGLVAGSRLRTPVCLEDILPTLLELAGSRPARPVDGQSLVAAMRGEQERVRDWLHLEHADCYSTEQAFHALTDGRFKYVWRTCDGTEQLFDLDHDPHELHDLSGAASSRGELVKWRALLVQRLAGRPEQFSDGVKLTPGRPYPALQRQPSRSK